MPKRETQRRKKGAAPPQSTASASRVSQRPSAPTTPRAAYRRAPRPLRVTTLAFFLAQWLLPRLPDFSVTKSGWVDWQWRVGQFALHRPTTSCVRRLTLRSIKVAVFREWRHNRSVPASRRHPSLGPETIERVDQADPNSQLAPVRLGTLHFPQQRRFPCSIPETICRCRHGRAPSSC